MDYGNPNELPNPCGWTRRVKTDTISVVPNYDVNDLTRLIASRIRGLMAQHGVKQADLAASINVSQSQLSKMLRGVRPIDLDQLDGMCLALGQQMSVIVAEAEEILAKLDAEPSARYIFVDDGLRLETPMDTEGWGNGPVIPLPEARTSIGMVEAALARAKEAGNVTRLPDDELRTVDLDDLQSNYATAAGNDETTDAEEESTP